jgi:hypothetical protein
MTFSIVFRKKWFWLSIVPGLIILTILGVSVFASHDRQNNASTEAFFSDPTHQTDFMLDDFPVYSQNYVNSCGPTTISMLYSWLVEPVSESEITERLGREPGKKGMLPGEFAKELQSVISDHGYVLEHLTNVSGNVFLDTVYAQLELGLPVPIYFSTENAWNIPNYDTHYSVITGYDNEEQLFSIANAYGFSQKISASELLSSVNFENYKNPPLDFRLGRLLGIIKPGNLYLISRQ